MIEINPDKWYHRPVHKYVRGWSYDTPEHICAYAWRVWLIFFHLALITSASVMTFILPLYWWFVPGSFRTFFTEIGALPGYIVLTCLAWISVMMFSGRTRLCKILYVEEAIDWIFNGYGKIVDIICVPITRKTREKDE